MLREPDDCGPGTPSVACILVGVLGDHVILMVDQRQGAAALDVDPLVHQQHLAFVIHHREPGTEFMRWSPGPHRFRPVIAV